jgi:hypothetical protein
MANADAGNGLPTGTTLPMVACPEPSWLPDTTPFVLTVATAPEISQVACENGGPGTQPSGGMGSGGGPPPSSVQPAQYPDPCDPNLACSADGSEYMYLTCATVDQGLCQPSFQNCTSVSYMRPTPVPAAWPCIH